MADTMNLVINDEASRSPGSAKLHLEDAKQAPVFISSMDEGPTTSIMALPKSKAAGEQLPPVQPIASPTTAASDRRDDRLATILSSSERGMKILWPLKYSKVAEDDIEVE